jgi:hypothetical protein
MSARFRLLSAAVASALLSGVVLGAVDAPPDAAAASATWSIVPSPNANSTTDFLTSVSCTSPDACTAAGYTETATNDETMIEEWNGSTWSLSSSPNPASNEGSYLSSVSCTSSDACTAAGYYYTASLIEQTLVEQWNGSSWTIVPSPNAGTADNMLTAVSCSSASTCVAVGDYEDGATEQTLIEQFNGSTWSVVTSPNTKSTLNNQLNAVSCPSATACTAVGSASNGVVDQTLVVAWNGSTWSIQSSPDTASADQNWLYGVSCASATACMAVGYDDTTMAQVALAEQWNGSSWSIVAVPNPISGGSSYFNSVSCPSAIACTAVGYYFGIGTPNLTFIAQWNGTSWSLVPSPNKSSKINNELKGVSCTFGSACTAVGTYVSPGYQTLIESLPPTFGYDLAGSDGGVFVFPTGQSSGFFGSLPGLGVRVSNIVGIVPTKDYTGYDLVGADGGVFVFPTGQSSGFFGSLPGLGVRVSNIVGIVPTKDYTGYDLVGADGGVFVFPVGQTAGFYGSLPGIKVRVNDIVGIVASPGGGGYFLVGRDGGVFTFGTAPFYGSLPGIKVSVDDITGIASTPDGKGYYVVGANGAVYAFGDAASHGSLPGIGVKVSDIVSIVPTPDGGGYWLIGSDGGVFAFGDATSAGSLPGLKVSVDNIVGAVPTG